MRKLFIAVVISALVPLTAVANESSTVEPQPETVTATTLPMVTLPAPQTLALIQTRMKTSKLPSRTGLIALQPDGWPLWRSRAYEPFIPASTMKVVTGVVALEVMGPNWKPITTVTFDETTGTLFLVGGGDPMLTSGNLRSLAGKVSDALTTQGLTAIALRIDDTLFPTPSRAPGVHASLEPQEVNPIRALTVDRRTSMNTSTIAGRVFADALQAAGVPVAYEGRGVARGTEIARHAGLRLSSILRTMLWYSDNDIAEIVFRLSAIASGRTGTWADARETAASELETLGLSMKNLVLVDGSGLSRNNRLTAASLAALLQIVQSREASSIIRGLLPRAGKEGTVRLRFRTEPAECVRNILQAKTGGLRDVVSLAGYAPSANGAPIPFAIIVNDLSSVSAANRARRSIDALAASFSGC